MVSWALAAIASILYRQRCPDEVAKLEWKQPLYPLFPLLGLSGIVVVTYSTFVGSAMTLVRGIIWMAALYLVFRFTARGGGKAAGTSI